MTASSASQQLSKLPLTDTTLANGLRVIIAPKHSSSVVTITLAYRVGAKDERLDNTGFAHLFEHLMFEGSTHVASGDFDRYCTMAGGHNNAYTTYDKTVYYMVLPSHQLEMGLWLESDRMLAFAIDENSLKVQQSVVSEEINQNVENQPYGRYAQTLAGTAFRENTLYSWEVYGSKEHIEQSSLEDVRRFYETWYRPDNACLVICGDAAPDYALGLVEKYFGSIPRSAQPAERKSFNPADRLGGKHTVVRDNIPMESVFLSFHLDGFLEQDYYTAEVLASILSDGMSSRLYKALVYEQQIAAEVGAYIDDREHSSLFTIYAVGNSGDSRCDRLVEAIEAVLREFSASGTDTREVLKARNRLLTRLARSFQRNSGIADELAHYTLFANDPGRAFRLPDYFNAVSPETLSDFALRTFRESARIRIDFVPAGSGE